MGFPVRPETIALQKRVLEAACASQMEFMQCQMAQWQMAQCRAAQMVQWQQAACANRAGQGSEPAAQWKEGDAFEVESTLMTCDKTNMRVEPQSFGMVHRLRGSGSKLMM